MKKCSFFIWMAIVLSACAIKKIPAPIEYRHEQSRLYGKSNASEETISIVNSNGEIVSPSNDHNFGQEEQQEPFDPEEDGNYIIPAKVPSLSNNNLVYHEVQAVETIETIAAKYGLSVEEVARLNDLYPPYYLDELQILKIKIDKNLVQAKPVSTNILQEKTLPPINKKTHDFIKPVEGAIITKFGESTKQGVNKGVNIAATAGALVKAAAAGRVIYADFDATFGNLVMIKVDNKNIVTAYAHLEDIILAKGTTVKQGDLIGYVGSTGKVGGKPQLHFAIREGKNAVDPMGYIDNHN